MKPRIPRAIRFLMFAGAQWGLAAFSFAAPPAVTHLKKILVLDKSQNGANSHLESRRDLNAALKGLAADKGFSLTFIGQNDGASIIASEFSAEKLATYQAVLFSNNEGIDSQLDSVSKANVETYVENGGGLIPVHAGQDFIAKWPWLTRSLVQSFYGPHGMNQPKADLDHDSAGIKGGTETQGIFRGLTAPTAFIDEYYSFRASPRDSAGVTILVTVDEKSFTKTIEGPMGEDHPVAWTKAEGKGRVVNFSLGHSWPTNNVYTAAGSYLTQLLYGILRYVAGDFTGCTDIAFEEYNPDATRNDSAACINPEPIAISGTGGKRSRPLISRNEGRPLVNVSFRNSGGHSVIMLDVSGRVVQMKNGTGPSHYSLSIPSQSGIYTVIARSGGKAERYRFTVL